jgi:hypothetical protein
VSPTNTFKHKQTKPYRKQAAQGYAKLQVSKNFPQSQCGKNTLSLQILDKK